MWRFQIHWSGEQTEQWSVKRRTRGQLHSKNYKDASLSESPNRVESVRVVQERPKQELVNSICIILGIVWLYVHQTSIILINEKVLIFLKKNILYIDRNQKYFTI